MYGGRIAMGRGIACGPGAWSLRAISNERMRREPASLATLVNSAREQHRIFSTAQELIRPWLFSLFVLLVAGSPAEATCVDPTALARSTISITRYFAGEDS